MFAISGLKFGYVVVKASKDRKLPYCFNLRLGIEIKSSFIIVLNKKKNVSDLRNICMA